MSPKQVKLVRALFNGATLSRAWALAGYSKKCHANLPKVMTWPHVRLLLEIGIDDGKKLRGPLHQKVLDALLVYSFQAPKPKQLRQRDDYGQFTKDLA